ncbi:5-formyltetrahydrofolate cyclo-ligase [Oricola sp.]|uniref:5-formyltetrahydrofolate cyclo-ligase n=1 Tax=Oricola sp. TaxID=1979950 RepID=UPI0025D09C65|nr:5-formyltetrahydrofolate cyclo-ligase [Oricola sp.]MCI5074033.1 5-formyltetrahydrofolate cyclo-ligase [Oricola sp.]
MHELDPAFRAETEDRQAAYDVSHWRKTQRERLIAERRAIPAEERTRLAGLIADRLDKEAGDPNGRIVSLYWPFRGEPDLRPWMQRVIDRGGRITLPVVVAKGEPLEFRLWSPGEKLERGIWNIPVPAAGEPVSPDIVISPLVGVDAERYRLGYGGGFYDRTLTAMATGPLVLGVGYACARLATIYPQWHDVRMDRIILA